jgi:8-oxo-dGTP pyrophosphatase MutT (NUDIX family)
MKDMLDVFGRFLDGKEDVEAALARELKEELGLNPSEYSTPTFLTVHPRQKIVIFTYTYLTYFYNGRLVS